MAKPRVLYPTGSRITRTLLPYQSRIYNVRTQQLCTSINVDVYPSTAKIVHPNKELLRFTAQHDISVDSLCALFVIALMRSKAAQITK